MLRDPARLAAFEDDLARRTPPDLRRALRLVEALRQEAVALGVWPPADRLAGLDTDRRVARAFNVRAAPR